MTAPSKHSKAATELRERLDAELAAVAQDAGVTLAWSAVDLELINASCNVLDRITDLQGAYNVADGKLAIRIASEIRQSEAHLERLLRRIKVEVPQAESQTTRKARRAANARWDQAARRA